MSNGTLLCKWFGHKFVVKTIEFDKKMKKNFGRDFSRHFKDRE